MSRLTPVFWLLLSFSLGIFLKTQSQLKFFIILSFLLTLFLIFTKPKSRPILLAILAFLIFGWLRASGYYSLERFEGKIVEIEGEIEKSVNNCSISLNSLIYKNQRYQVAGKVFLSISSPLAFHQSEKVRLRGQLTKNSNGYFFFRNLKTIKKTSSQYEKILTKIKSRARQLFEENLPPEEANFVISSLFGRTETNPKLYGFFQKAGVAHLLAISGLHVGFLFLFLLSIFSFLPRFPRYLLTFSFLLGYAALADFTPSVVRAFLMLSISFVTLEIGRSQQIINNLSVACFIMLLFNPFLLFSISFQLSALAVAGIGFFKPRLDQIISVYPEGLKSLINLTLSAQLGTLPLVLYLFERFPLVSLLSNLLIIPLFSFATSIAFLSFILSSFAPFLALPLMPFLFLISRVIIFTVKTLSFLPLASPPLTLAAVFSISSIFLFKAFHKQNFKINFFNLVIYYLLLLSLALWYYSLTIYFQTPTFTFINVGQGDACLIQLPRGQNLLIDGGSSTFLLYKRLSSLPIQKIDAVILSHPHQDHLGGLQSLPDNLITWSLYSQEYPQSKEFRELVSKYQKAKIKIHLIKKPTIFKANEGTIKFLPVNLEDNPNESPLVAIFNIGNFSFLFPGDAGEKTQNWLAKKLKPATVLKLPHHGGFLLPEFLSKAKPKIGIISLAKNNQYGHPKPEVISLLKKKKVKVYRTDENGWIKIRNQGKYLTIVSQFPGN